MTDTKSHVEPAPWMAHHAWIVGLLSVQAVGLALTAIMRPETTSAWALVPALTLVGPALLSVMPRQTLLLTAAVSAAALVIQAAFAVAMFGGDVRANFLMLAVLCVVALYEVGVVLAITFTAATLVVVAVAAFSPRTLESGHSGMWTAYVAGAVAFAVTGIAGVILWRDYRKTRHTAEQQRRATEAYLDVASSMMIVLDRRGVVTVANRQACITLDREPEEIIGHKWFDVALPEEDRAEAEMRFQGFLAAYEEIGEAAYMPTDYENEIATKEGERRHVVWWATMIADRHGAPINMVCSGTDVTEARENQRALKRSGVELEALRRLAQKVASLDDSRQAVVDAAIDLTGATMAGIMEPDRTRSRLAFTTSTWRELVGHTIELGRESAFAATAFLSGQPQFVSDLRNTPGTNRALVAKSDMISVVHQPIVSANGTIGVLSVGWSEKVPSLHERRAELVGLIAHEAAIALRRRESLAQLERAALVDPLTGVANRRAFDAEFPVALRRAGENNDTLGLVAIDLNEFKAINDIQGHEAGDAVLIDAAAAWADALRAGDLLARIGGDEFAVLLPSCDAGELHNIIDRLQRVTPHGPGASIGGAMWDGAENAASMIRRADHAQYENKAAMKKRMGIVPGRPVDGARAPRVADPRTPPASVAPVEPPLGTDERHPGDAAA